MVPSGSDLTVTPGPSAVGDDVTAAEINDQQLGSTSSAQNEGTLAVVPD